MPHRRSIRLKGYDYSQLGAYFVTICLQNRECLFGNIVNEEMKLNDAGRMIQNIWIGIPNKFSGFEGDHFIVMPNHLHGILHRRGESCIRPALKGDHEDRPYGTQLNTISRVLQYFKSVSTFQYIEGVKKMAWPPFSGKLWQRNYYEHIVRNEDDLNKIREYIITNPAQWAEDEMFTPNSYSPNKFLKIN